MNNIIEVNLTVDSNEVFGVIAGQQVEHKMPKEGFVEKETELEDVEQNPIGEANPDGSNNQNTDFEKIRELNKRERYELILKSLIGTNRPHDDLTALQLSEMLQYYGALPIPSMQTRGWIVGKVRDNLLTEHGNMFNQAEVDDLRIHPNAMMRAITYDFNDQTWNNMLAAWRQAKSEL